VSTKCNDDYTHGLLLSFSFSFFSLSSLTLLVTRLGRDASMLCLLSTRSSPLPQSAVTLSSYRVNFRSSRLRNTARDRQDMCMFTLTAVVVEQVSRPPPNPTFAHLPAKHGGATARFAVTHLPTKPDIAPSPCPPATVTPTLATSADLLGLHTYKSRDDDVR
jgi:hypothetical protein